MLSKWFVFVLFAIVGNVALADTVTCESQDGRRAECPMDTRGEVRLVRQVSDSPCRQGVSWGYSRHTVWVDRGCRAVFSNDRGYGGGDWRPGPGWDSRFVVRCRSDNYSYNFCAVDVGRGGRASLDRQISSSSCAQGRTWGWNRAGIWVDQGCEGDFRIDRRWR